MTSLKDIDHTIKFIGKHKIRKKLVLLQTTSDYPAKNIDVNLNVIPEYIKRYKIPVGFSDHTLDHTASLGAIAMGACVVEKHFTINKKFSGPDHKASLEPRELKEWIEKIRIIEKKTGKVVLTSQNIFKFDYFNLS